MEEFDLLTTVEYGGCSAKLSPDTLSKLLKNIPILGDSNVMVDISTHYDAGVYRINESTALIVTTDFFPPVCSNAIEFGQIAAANSLSDVYAMGGKPLLALNLNMFPSDKIPIEVLKDILLGGQDKINEAGAITMGGHTIEDYPPKYGLAVVGTVHPDELITNSGAKAGQSLILTKPLGTGVAVAAHRMKMGETKTYESALHEMKRLNRVGMELMQKYGVKGATDVTGFGLLGHAVEMARGSGVTIQIDALQLPAIQGVLNLIDEGCVPGGAFRNLNYVKESVFFGKSCIANRKLLACDPQTSGGLLIAVDADKAHALLSDLRMTNHLQCAIIGEVIEQREKAIYIY